MARLANKFVNPGTAFEYVWPINHSEESEVEISRSISHGANTANTGLIRQQGDDLPLVFELQGTIFLESQHRAFIEWSNLCKTQTIVFDKYDGDSFEVFITQYRPVQKKTIHNPKDSANAPLWYWAYQMQLEVVTVLAGNFIGIV